MTNVFKIEIEKLKQIDKRYKKLFNNNDFLEYDDINSEVKKLIPRKLDFSLKYLFYYFTYRKYDDLFHEKKDMLSRANNDVDKHNKLVLQYAIKNFNNICGKIEDNDLDNQQIEAIVRKNNNQLVIAGAGSGKTTTIVGKVKYLLKSNQYNPEDILLLSFTDASAREMKERVKNETGIDLDVFTFHKLGLDIIKSSIGKVVKVFDKDLYDIVKKIINEKIKDFDYFNKLIHFMATARFDIKDEFDFRTEKEYEEFLKTNKPTTLKGEIVKSYGELEIANYLFAHNIDYEYEKDYEFDTATEEHQQYTPDFYLPKYGIYIEYFGINRNQKVAPFFKSKNGKSASETYNDSINWKREIHRKNNTKLIETFYYEKKEKTLISNLEKQLIANNVKLELRTSGEIFEIINKNNVGLFGEVCKSFGTIINLIKSNNYSFEYLYSLELVQRLYLNVLTLDLVRPIYDAYQRILEENDMIDFNDMINMATLFVSENKYVHNYKYVIVDEYQDMSNARYRLLSALRNQKNYKLFCVGDDWQSIYRFSGSDINLITHFKDYWGKTYISFIERTYRFTSMMSELSGNFIMRNPNQYKKQIDAKISDDLAIGFINAYSEHKCVDFLNEKLCKLEHNSTVYFLGRYSFDIDIIRNNRGYTLKYDYSSNVIDITFNRRKDLKIKFLTIHKSKGLQADYVVILNNKNYGMGFPSKINDLPIINILLDGDLDNYSYSEERRLFYVALTRSKKKTFLFTVKDNKSCFVTELEDDYNNLMKFDSELKNNIYTCPECGGRLLVRDGKYGKFIGCSNYPGCRYTKDIK